MITITLPVWTGKMVPCPEMIHREDAEITIGGLPAKREDLRYQHCKRCGGKTFSPEDVREMVEVVFSLQDRKGVADARTLTIPGVGQLSEGDTKALGRLLVAWDNDATKTVEFH